MLDRLISPFPNPNPPDFVFMPWSMLVPWKFDRLSSSFEIGSGRGPEA